MRGGESRLGDGAGGGGPRLHPGMARRHEAQPWAQSTWAQEKRRQGQACSHPSLQPPEFSSPDAVAAREGAVAAGSRNNKALL